MSPARVRAFVGEAVTFLVYLYPVYILGPTLLTESTPRAFRNAERLISWEQSLGLYRERAIQRWFLPHAWVIGFWNVFYGSLHFVVPILTLLALYGFDNARYVRWRNTWLSAVLVIEQLAETATVFGKKGFIAPGGAMNFLVGAPLFVLWVIAAAATVTLHDRGDDVASVR